MLTGRRPANVLEAFRAVRAIQSEQVEVVRERGLALAKVGELERAWCDHADEAAVAELPRPAAASICSP